MSDEPQSPITELAAAAAQLHELSPPASPKHKPSIWWVNCFGHRRPLHEGAPMKVIAPDDFSFVTALERPVEKGEELEVDDELGAALVEQGWKIAGRRVSAGNKTAEAAASSSTPNEE